jgi:hypothetical protein
LSEQKRAQVRAQILLISQNYNRVVGVNLLVSPHKI